MSRVKLKKERGGEWSRGGDQVFGSRVTTSTLAGQYVTARELVGGRVSCGNCGTISSFTRRGIRGKLRWRTYVLKKRGRLTMELGVVMTRQLVSLFLLRVLVCCVRARGDRGRHERGAG